MSAKTLLTELTRLGVTLHRGGGKLLFIDPKRALTPPLKAELQTQHAGKTTNFGDSIAPVIRQTQQNVTHRT